MNQLGFNLPSTFQEQLMQVLLACPSSSHISHSYQTNKTCYFIGLKHIIVYICNTKAIF